MQVSEQQIQDMISEGAPHHEAPEAVVEAEVVTPEQFAEALDNSAPGDVNAPTPTTTAPEPANANRPGMPRILNFIEDVVQPKSKEGAGAAMVALLSNIVKYSMSQGFSEEQATRACALWLMEICWRTLTSNTMLMGQAMLGIAMPPQTPAQPEQPVAQ